MRKTNAVQKLVAQTDVAAMIVLITAKLHAAIMVAVVKIVTITVAK